MMNIILTAADEPALLSVMERRPSSGLIDQGHLGFKWVDRPSAGRVVTATLVPLGRRYIVTFRLEKFAAMDVVMLLRKEMSYLGYHLLVDDTTLAHVQRAMNESYKIYEKKKEG